MLEAVGEGVTKVQTGKKWRHPAHHFGVCPACRARRNNLGEKMVFLGSEAYSALPALTRALWMHEASNGH